MQALIALKQGYQNVESLGYILLHHYVIDKDVALYLLKNGADVNVCSSIGYNLLMLCAATAS
jgi:hypothetical protein